MALGRAWCFTMFDEQHVHRIQTLNNLRALVIGREICPTTKKEHYQGYVRFDKPCRLSWWKNQFPTVHVELRKGSEEQAANYCRKEGNVIVDFGCKIDDPPTVNKGEKVPTIDTTTHVLDMLEDGAPLWQIYKRHRIFYFHNAKKIKEMKEDMDTWNTFHNIDYKRDR